MTSPPRTAIIETTPMIMRNTPASDCRRVPSGVLGGLDGDAPARAVIEEQDRLIAEKSGTPALAVKNIHRSGSKKDDESVRPLRHASASN